MRKNGKQVDAELRSDGEYGWECLFLYNGELAYSRRGVLRADALAEAEQKRRELDAVGCRDEKPAESAGFSGTNRDD